MKLKHKAKKSLGQNFLKSEKVLNDIINAGAITEKDIILEIGPGKGFLTEKLLSKAKKVIAIEKDNNLFSFLSNKFRKEIEGGSLLLLHGDALNFAPEKYKMKKGEYKLIANIPYNITGLILKKFLTEKTNPALMVLMLQYEVVKRILAKDGKESILSISVKAYGKPKMIEKVSARYFSPKPKVDSAIISIENISRKLFFNNKISETLFWSLIHKGFAHKRKKLSGNLKDFPNLNQEVLEKFKDKRAEDLSLSDWISLI